MPETKTTAEGASGVSALPPYNKAEFAVPLRSEPRVFLGKEQDSTYFFDGLYILYAKTGEGKTLSTYTLAKKAQGRYWGLNEPGSDIIEDPVKIELIIKEKLSNWGSGKQHLLCVDSLNVWLSVASAAYRVPAFEKGQHAGHNIALLRLDALARAAKSVIVGTINTDLVPLKDLKGACEGALRISAPGTLMQKSDREIREWTAAPIATSEEVDEFAEFLHLEKRGKKNAMRVQF